VQRNTQKPVPEDKRLRKGGRRKNSAHAIMMRETDNKSENDSFSSVRDLNGELSENEPGGYADWNASINSLTGWGANNSSSALQTMAALVEQATDGDEGESHKSSTVAKKKLGSRRSFRFHNRQRKNCRIDRPSRKSKKTSQCQIQQGRFHCRADLVHLGNPKHGQIGTPLRPQRS
jgi:hypothetical protein